MIIKKKLRDVNSREYKEWVKKRKCSLAECERCVFNKVVCAKNSDRNWVNNKDLYSDKFLDQEIEVECTYLDDVEKKYLENMLRPFKDRKIKIRKVNFCNNKFEYIIIIVKTLNNNDFLEYENISMPCFLKGTMYRNMELKKEYTSKELGLFDGDK